MEKKSLCANSNNQKQNDRSCVGSYNNMKKYLPLLALIAFATSAFVVIGLCMGVKLPEIIGKLFSAVFFACIGVVLFLVFVSMANNRDE